MLSSNLFSSLLVVKVRNSNKYHLGRASTAWISVHISPLQETRILYPLTCSQSDAWGTREKVENFVYGSSLVPSGRVSVLRGQFRDIWTWDWATKIVWMPWFWVTHWRKVKCRTLACWPITSPWIWDRHGLKCGLHLFLFPALCHYRGCERGTMLYSPACLFPQVPWMIISSTPSKFRTTGHTLSVALMVWLFCLFKLTNSSNQCPLSF